jgi:hypothetical protein
LLVWAEGSACEGSLLAMLCALSTLQGDMHSSLSWLVAGVFCSVASSAVCCVSSSQCICRRWCAVSCVCMAAAVSILLTAAAASAARIVLLVGSHLGCYHSSSAHMTAHACFHMFNACAYVWASSSSVRGPSVLSRAWFDQAV